MLLDFLDQREAATEVRSAVDAALAGGAATADLGGAQTTAQLGGAVLAQLGAGGAR